MAAHQNFVKDGEIYAKDFKDGDLALPPAERLIIVTCMDARVEPHRQLRKKLGACHIIRNAGGCARDAVRSIVISQRLLGTREIAVFHHTDCGMLTFTTPQLQSIVKDAAPGNSEIAKEVDNIDFLTFPDLEKSVKDDVLFLKENKLVLNESVITGWIYDVKTGKSRQVV